MNDFVLYVSDYGAMLWHARYAPQGLRAAHPDQARDLGEILRRHARLGVVMLADDAGQELRLDQIPKLGWFDRRALLRRRVEQAFSPSGQAACLACRKYDAGWMASYGYLPDRGGSRVWSLWLEKQANPRRGTILTGDAAAALIVRSRRYAAPEWEHVFILTPAGLRQVTIRRGMPVLTRLIPCRDAGGDGDGAALGAAMIQAQAESQNYLARQGWRHEASKRMIVIAPISVVADLRQVLPPEATVASPEEVAAALGLPACREGGALLAAACLARRRQLGVIQPAPAAAAQRNVYWRRWGWAATGLVVIGIVGMAGRDMLAARAARDATHASLAESRQWQARLAEVRRRLENNMTQPMRQRQVEVLRAAVLSPAPMPWATLHILGQNLPGQIRLGALDWLAEAHGGTAMQLTLRLFPLATEKDAAQAEALRLYQDLITKMAAALPRAQIKAVQAPYALDAAHPFNDPAMLRSDGAQQPMALLEIREP